MDRDEIQSSDLSLSDKLLSLRFDISAVQSQNRRDLQSQSLNLRPNHKIYICHKTNHLQVFSRVEDPNNAGERAYHTHHT